MRVRLTVPKEHVDADTLNPALEASAAVAEKQIDAGLVPPLADAIEDKSVVWAPEPTGQGFEGFDLPTQCLDRGWGDCDDLAPWWAAELRYSGVDPDAKPIVYQSGPKRWHAVVERGDGSIDDPSRWAGMGKPGSKLPTTRPLSPKARTAIAFKQQLSGTKARIDVPLLGMGDHVGLALERIGDGAFDALGKTAGAALGLLGFWGSPEETIRAMHAITHILSGRSEEEFAAIHGCGYEMCGEFVCGLADRIGAMHATTTFDPHMATDIATTILDPLGIHNLVAPLASDFVKSYATGLAHRGEDAPAAAPKKSDDTTKTGGDVRRATRIGDPCPEGWHWEWRGGINICVPDKKVDGAEVGRKPYKTKRQWNFFGTPIVGARGKPRGKGGSGGGRGGGDGSRGGGRGGSSRDQGGYGDQGGPPSYYNEMDYEGGQYNPSGPGYGMSPGWTPQQYSMPSYGYPMMPQAPAFPAPQGGFVNPYGPPLPMTDLAPDAWGGYATPTAFSQYVDQYEKGIRHSAFDDAPLLGDGDHVTVTLRATGEKITVPKDQVQSLRDAGFINGARVAQDFTEGEEYEWGRQ